MQRVRESARKTVEPANPRSYPQNEHTIVYPNLMPQALATGHRSQSVDSEASPIATIEKTRRAVEKEPPKDLLLSLTSLFFRHIHPWLPFLDTQRVFADMGLLKSIPLLYYALFGISMPYSYDPRLDHRSSDSFWTYSKRRIFVDVLEEPSFMSLEALTILTLDLSGMTNGPQVWGALAIAVNLSVQLKSVDNRVFRKSAEDRMDTALNDTEQMHRRRLFWAIYALDSYITITTGHLSDLSDHHIQYFLPYRYVTWRGLSAPIRSSADESSGLRDNDENDFLNATPTFVFSYQLKLMDISRKLHKAHIQRPSFDTETWAYQWAQDFLDCSTELFEWFQNLPRCLLPSYEGDRRLNIACIPSSMVMLHAYYHALVVHLHCLAAYPLDEVIHAQVSQHTNESRQNCMHSIESLTTIVSLLDKEICADLGWPFAWAIWIACRYLLVRNRAEGRRDMASFYILLDCLKNLSKYWQISGKYWRLLNQAAAEFEARPESEGTPASQSVLHAITDLRISTSDLEDRSRPDPVIYSATAARGRNVNVDKVIPDFDINSRIQNFNDPMSEDAFNMSGLASDNWFSASLFATSGYEQ